MGALTKRIDRLEQKAGVDDPMKIFVTIDGEPIGEANPELGFERLRERFGFKGKQPDVLVFVTSIEKGPDGTERVKFSHPLAQTDLE